MCRSVLSRGARMHACMYTEVRPSTHTSTQTHKHKRQANASAGTHETQKDPHDTYYTPDTHTRDKHTYTYTYLHTLTHSPTRKHAQSQVPRDAEHARAARPLHGDQLGACKDVHARGTHARTRTPTHAHVHTHTHAHTHTHTQTRTIAGTL